MTKANHNTSVLNDLNNAISVYLLVGTNLGKRLNNIINAQASIVEQLGEITACSHIYETEAWGYSSANSFYNQALQIKTNLSPSDLMSKIKEIENKNGKIRNHPGRYVDRTLDIDILFYGSMVINHNGLIIPHPLLHLRKFVLAPLNEIAPDLLHPVLNKKIKQLLTECRDKNTIKKSLIKFSKLCKNQEENL